MAIKNMSVNENHGAFILVGVAVLLVVFLSVVLPGTMDGMNYAEAIGDSFGLRIAKLAAFDLHVIGLLYVYGGNSWRVIQTLKSKPVSTSILLASMLIGSALMLM